MSLTFSPTRNVLSWGRVSRTEQRLASPRFRSDLSSLAGKDQDPRLAIGLRRSYGDTALFQGGRLVDMRRLDRFIALDPVTGLLRAEAGLSLGALLTICVPQGWFVPVTPGTRQVTLGGAVANDVHGKNHHVMGTFGRHVLAFTLLRSDRGLVEVTPENEPELFAATIGGLGLTGVILDVTLQLTPIVSAHLDAESLPLGRLADFYALDGESTLGFEHTVAWVDCTRQGDRVGMGVYTRANWAKEGGLIPHQMGQIPFPLETPGWVINRLSLGAFNRFYRAVQLARTSKARAHYAKIFYPLDAIGDWNRVYGRRGFYQYQCVLPKGESELAIGEILRHVARSGEGSALVVLKAFGEARSPGLMSFPRPGHTLALDFRNRGSLTLALMASLDAIVRQAGGALYPAKDGRMSRDMLDLGYPQFQRLLASRDPACGSDFLARMEG